MRKIVIPEIKSIHLQNTGKIENIVFLGEEQPDGYYCSRKVIFQENSTNKYKNHFEPCFCNFNDKPSLWAKKEIDEATELKLITERTSYGYKSVITRSEAVELVVKMIEKTLGHEIVGEKDVFVDTNNAAAEQAYAVDIILGVGNNSFSPGQLVKREEYATMLYRTVKFLEDKKGIFIGEEDYNIEAYKDNKDVSEWTAEAMGILCSIGIIKGKGDSLLAPKENMTVEEAIILVKRTYEMIANSSFSS